MKLLLVNILLAVTLASARPEMKNVVPILTRITGTQEGLDRQETGEEYKECGSETVMVAGTTYTFEPPSRSLCVRTFTVSPGLAPRIDCYNVQSGNRIDISFKQSYLVIPKKLSGFYFDDFGVGATPYDIVVTHSDTRKGNAHYCTLLAPIPPTTEPPTTTDPSATTTTATPQAVDCGVRNAPPSDRIFNGTDADTNEWPWQAALVPTSNLNFVFCGASVVNAEWILTAAHCVVGEGNIVDLPGQLKVVVGKHLYGSNADALILDVAQVLPHPDYQASAFPVHHDYALLRLDEPIVFPADNTIAPVCLPPSGETDQYVGRTATVTGWGNVDSSSTVQPSELQELNMTVLSDSVCRDKLQETYPAPRYYIAPLTDTEVCALSSLGDTCNGDSGGPLVTEESDRYTLVGAVSYGYLTKSNQCFYGQIAVFARVTGALTWIEDNIGYAYRPT